MGPGRLSRGAAKKRVDRTYTRRWRACVDWRTAEHRYRQYTRTRRCSVVICCAPQAPVHRHLPIKHRHAHTAAVELCKTGWTDREQPASAIVLIVQLYRIFTARRYASVVFAVIVYVRLSVCQSRYCIETTGQIELVLALGLLFADSKNLRISILHCIMRKFTYFQK